MPKITAFNEINTRLDEINLRIESLIGYVKRKVDSSKDGKSLIDEGFIFHCKSQYLSIVTDYANIDSLLLITNQPIEERQKQLDRRCSLLKDMVWALDSVAAEKRG